LISTKTKIALAEPIEGSAVGTGDVGIQRLSGRHEPRIVLAHPARRAALQECAPLCLRECIAASSRRWEARGVLRTIVLMWRLRLSYFLGADPADLALLYDGARTRG